jgi:hypothetical protein
MGIASLHPSYALTRLRSRTQQSLDSNPSLGAERSSPASRPDGGLRLPPLLLLLRSSSFGGPVELRRTSRLQPALRAKQIITAHVISDPRLFIDACPNCPHDDRGTEDMRRAERRILCRRQNSSLKTRASPWADRARPIGRPVRRFSFNTGA